VRPGSAECGKVRAAYSGVRQLPQRMYAHSFAACLLERAGERCSVAAQRTLQHEPRCKREVRCAL